MNGICPVSNLWQSAAEERGDARLLKEDIFKLDHEVEQRRKSRAEQASVEASDDMEDGENANELTDHSHKKCKATRMLVDLHRPTSFVSLLSDERINRNVLSWLKEWDPLVFSSRDGRKKPLRGDNPLNPLHSVDCSWHYEQ